jgi:hypothetical protein
MTAPGFICRIPHLAALIVVLTVVVVFPMRALGETFQVPGDRARTIGQAIDLAELNTDTSNIIEVATGTYSESTLTISKSLTIRGKDGAKVVVRAAGDPLVIVGGTSSSVTLANLILSTSGTAVRIDTAASVTLRNLVIKLASTAIRCNIQTTTASVDHVTFVQVTNGVDCQTSTIPIRNNIFSVVSGTPIFPFTQLGAILPNYNLFHAATGPRGERGDNAFPNESDRDEDPRFVNIDNNDFHLQEGSAAIDKGVSPINDPVDLGAYGGLLAGSDVPFPPKKPTATCGDPNSTSCRVSWEANLDHAVTGYLVLTSAPAAPDPNYGQTDAVENANAQCTGSPPVCSFTRGSLLDSGTAPGQPSTPTANFGDTRVDLSWPKVAGATAYEVHVGTAPNSGTLAKTVSVNHARIEGLTNGTLYYFSVRALNQPKFYAAVKSTDENPVLATSPASEMSEADAVTYGTAGVGRLSAEVTSIPQPLVAFPPLDDAGGCFIATAAYGSSLAPQVDILRAFREHYLRPYRPGRAVIRLYETWSPPLADAIRSSDALRFVVKAVLWPIVVSAWIALYGPWWIILMIAGAGAAVVVPVLLRRSGVARA